MDENEPEDVPTEPVQEPAAEPVEDSVTEPLPESIVDTVAEPVAEPDHASLAEGLATHGIELTEEQIEQLDAYRMMLWEWNEKINLTRHTTIEKFIVRDLFDTLQLSKLLDKGIRVLDIGSGGGVPGITLAILRPDLELALCESVAKKSAVLQAMVEDLGLNVSVYAARVEVILEDISFDRLIARAVAPLWKFLFWLKPHKFAFGKLILIKGPSWVNERGEARHKGLTSGFDLRREAEYTTPGTESADSPAVSTILSVTPATLNKPKHGKHRGR